MRVERRDVVRRLALMIFRGMPPHPARAHPVRVPRASRTPRECAIPLTAALPPVTVYRGGHVRSASAEDSTPSELPLRRKFGMPARQTSGRVVVLLLAVLLAAAPAFPAAEEHRPFGLQLDSPAPGQRVRLSLPAVKVSGRAAGADLYASDIVIAIDVSNSALLASGVDVDGDGAVGTTRRWAKRGGGRGRPHREWTTHRRHDHPLKLIAAKFLIAGLAPRKNRIGVLTYTGSTRVRAEIGPPDDALDAVERIRIVENWSGTDIARALGKAAKMLDEAQPLPGPKRQRTVLLSPTESPPAPPPSTGRVARPSRRPVNSLSGRSGCARSPSERTRTWSSCRGWRW